MLPETVAAWGLHAYQDEEGRWNIQPRADSTEWKLQQVDEQWLLLVKSVPQIYFQTSEALAFVRRWLREQGAVD